MSSVSNWGVNECHSCCTHCGQRTKLWICIQGLSGSLVSFNPQGMPTTYENLIFSYQEKNTSTLEALEEWTYPRITQGFAHIKLGKWSMWTHSPIKYNLTSLEREIQTGPGLGFSSSSCLSSFSSSCLSLTFLLLLFFFQWVPYMVTHS